MFVTLVLRRGGEVASATQTLFDPVLRNAQQREKIAPGIFKFSLSFHYSGKKNPTYHLKIFEVIRSQNTVYKLELSFSNIFSKKKKKHENCISIERKHSHLYTGSKFRVI